MPIFVDKSNQNGWAHLVSDLAGESGKHELMQFGIRIGLVKRLHRISTYAEHYDIRGKEIERALMAGAMKVSRRELAQILRRKKRIEGPVLSINLTGP